MSLFQIIFQRQLGRGQFADVDVSRQGFGIVTLQKFNALPDFKDIINQNFIGAFKGRKEIFVEWSYRDFIGPGIGDLNSGGDKAFGVGIQRIEDNTDIASHAAIGIPQGVCV
ncbi:MAG: hypothetical protein BWY71_01747 [Planctomycetes bacterium ADurb.Bin412]|nr:MAG: hypothetical protein BWY71_01747 [Planctomycetes bacterium ADurb.Bin412]